jgi:hypothetical protein
VGFTALLAAADRAALQNLGGPVRYTAGSGVTADVVGVFDSAYVKVDAGQAGVSSMGPAVFLRLADLPSDPEIDSPIVTVESVNHVVREVQKDGLGGVLLLMHRT